MRKPCIETEVVKRPRCKFWVKEGISPEELPKVEEGFKIQPKRWVVERTLAWFNRYRRLSKEYDRLTTTTKSFICLTMSTIMLKRKYA